MSRKLRHTSFNPAVSAASQGAYDFYGHGIWLYHEPDAMPAYYIVGSDPGLSFISKWIHAGERMVTGISNTTHGTWPIRRAIEPFLW